MLILHDAQKNYKKKRLSYDDQNFNIKTHQIVDLFKLNINKNKL